MSESNQSDGGETITEALDRAIEHHRNGELTKAEWAYQEVLEYEPNHPDALHLLGVLFHQLGDSDSAIERVQASLASNPDQPKALNNLGNIFAAAKRSEDAIETYQKAIDLKPNYTEAIHNLGNVYNELDRLTESVECFRRAIELVEDDATTWSALGAAYEKLSQFDDAIEAYQTASSLDEDSVGPLSRLGAVYRKLNQIDRARSIYEKWLELKPDDPIATHFLHACSPTEDSPTRASVDYVRSTFDSFAEEFDDCLEGLGYQVPKLLGEMAEEYVDAMEDDSLAIVDLGCGTGLCASHLRPLAKRLVGVDLSPNMLFYAKLREAYDDLVESDLIQYLESTTDRFDVILSADTLLYLGDLRPTFAAAANVLTDQGIVIFSLEALAGNDSSGFQLRPSGRYAHSEACVREWIEQAGLKIREIRQAMLRQEGTELISGFLVAAGK